MIHPKCQKWIDESIKKMIASLKKSHASKKKIDSDFFFELFTMVRVELPHYEVEDENDEVLVWLRANQGAFNRAYHVRLKANGLLGFLRTAAANDLTTETENLPGFGKIAEKSWTVRVLSFLIENPNEKWFAL